MKRGDSAASGSTLMLALWALIVVSTVVFAWVVAIDKGIDAGNEANRAMEARALAHSGMAVALHPAVSAASPCLSARLSPGQSFRVTVQSEGGRLNLNYLLAPGDPAKLEFFKRYLASRGLSLQQRDRFVDSLVDWVAPVGSPRPVNAAPEAPAYRPPHRPLQSLDEIPCVAGSSPLVSNARWREDFTLLSTGPLDLENVGEDLLALVPGVGKMRARRFVERRGELLQKGGDGKGHPFRNVAEALDVLGMQRQELEALGALLGFRDPVVRLCSEGVSGDTTREMIAIARKTPDGATEVLWWNEN